MNPIFDFLNRLLETEGFPPRWFCGTGWQPFTGWFMIVSDLLIFGAYTSIPLLLLYFVSQKKEMVFPKIFWLFAAFIFACGISHLLDAIMFWWPAYRLNALERFLTGLISWATVFTLIPIVPMALALRSPAALEREINEREKAERRLQQLNMDLERMVTQRTLELDEKARQLEAANHELEAFSYSVSHDLQSPLRKIEQFSGLLVTNQGDDLKENVRLYLERISANASQMRGLIEEMLLFSRAANVELNKAPVNLSALVQQLLDDFQEQEPARQAEFNVQSDLIAEVDPVLIENVLGNLLGNAWKYSSQEPVARLEFGVTEENGRRVYFVKDNGVGFEMSGVERIFRPFQRLHHKTEFPGSGIGLASVQRIINRHGGRVWAHGEPGAGATFFFSLGEAT